MRTINIMSGVPGCGKTTFINNNAQLSEVKLHRDDFRSNLRKIMKTDEYFPVPASEEWGLWTHNINKHIELFPEENIWIDQTTIGTGALAKLIKDLHLVDGDHIIVHVFNLPLDVCMQRNAQRTGMARVPDSVLESMHTNFTSKLITKSTARRVAIQTNIKATIDVVFHNEP